MRVFTTKRPNAFKSFRKVLKAFITEVDEEKNTTFIAIKAVPNCGGDKRKTKNVVLCTRFYSPLPFRDVFAFYVAGKNQATEWPPAHFS